MQQERCVPGRPGPRATPPCPGSPSPRPRPLPIRPAVPLRPSTRPHIRTGLHRAPALCRELGAIDVRLRLQAASAPVTRTRRSPRPPPLSPRPALVPTVPTPGHGRWGPRTLLAVSSSSSATSPPYSPRSSFRKLLPLWPLPWPSTPCGVCGPPVPGRHGGRWLLSGGHGALCRGEEGVVGCPRARTVSSRARGHPRLPATPARRGPEPWPLPPPGGQLCPRCPLPGPPRSAGGKGRGLPIVRKQQPHVAGAP